MIALNPAPLITRPARSQTLPEEQPGPFVIPSTSTPLSTSSVEGQPQSASLAEALAKVKTPEDDAIAQQQQAFDQMMQLRTEQAREANAIREFGLAQQKKENDFLNEYIRMI
jgi:hypothetical protein